MYQKHTWVSKEVIRREYLQNIEDGIYNEQERAIAAENALSGSISDETSRAVVKENALSASIVELTNNLTSETSRATAKENAIESALNDEIDRAIAAETALTGTINDISDALSEEIERATNYVKKTDYANTVDYGIVKVDGTTVLSNLGVLSVKLDSALSTTSINPVQNSTLTAALNSIRDEIAVIRQLIEPLVGNTYLTDESGNKLVTEDDVRIIIDY